MQHSRNVCRYDPIVSKAAAKTSVGGSFGLVHEGRLYRGLLSHFFCGHAQIAPSQTVDHSEQIPMRRTSHPPSPVPISDAFLRPRPLTADGARAELLRETPMPTPKSDALHFLQPAVRALQDADHTQLPDRDTADEMLASPRVRQIDGRCLAPCVYIRVIEKPRWRV